jgi:hypothetical protein
VKIIRLSIVFIIVLTLFIQGCTPPEVQFSELAQDYDVVIMKHCYPASDVLDDTGLASPSSPRQSLENYKAVYRLLRDRFDQNPDTLFIIWTLPPLHRLSEPSEGDKDANASRATEFSNWFKDDYLAEEGFHPNIYIWDFRGLVMNPNTNFLRYEYESNHDSSDSHPNKLANNHAGPQFAQFIVDSIADFYDSNIVGEKARIVFLHHSTGRNVYEYTDLGVPAWIDKYNKSNGVNNLITSIWYPSDGNMPVHYYRSWLTDQ